MDIGLKYQSDNGDLAAAYPGDAAFDLPAAEDCYLEPGARELVPTGVRVAIPEHHAGLVLPRSGLALKHGITVLNSPGLIDSGYRGDVSVLLYNASQQVYDAHDDGRVSFNGYGAYKVTAGDRIAQLLILPLPYLVLFRVPELLDETVRDLAGFGSSGQ